MTAREQNLIRLEAWDNYVRAKEKYIACRTQLEKWGKLLDGVARKLSNQPVAVIEQDYAWVPNHQTFAKGVEDFQVAGREFKRAWISARDCGFPVGKDELNELGGA